MPNLSLRLEHFSTDYINLYGEKGTTWLDIYSENGEVTLKEQDDICNFIKTLGGLSMLIDTRDWNTFDYMLNHAVIDSIVESAHDIFSIIVKSDMNDETNSIAFIDINYEEGKEGDDIEETIKEINLMFLKLLEPFSLGKLGGGYASGAFYFEVEINSESELAMNFIDFNYG